CALMAVASAPVKFGVSPRRVSAMLTIIEPEKPGPKTAITPLSTAFVAIALAMPGLDCVSLIALSIFLPMMPPAALVSLIAISTPFLKLVPAVAPVPDSSWMLATLMVSWANAPVAQ